MAAGNTEAADAGGGTNTNQENAGGTKTDGSNKGKKKISWFKKIQNKISWFLFRKKKLPRQYLCPISHSLMVDPQTIASGHTVDNSSITVCLCYQKYPILPNGVRADFSSQKTNQPLKDEIIQWCKSNGFSKPKAIQGHEQTKRLNKLMENQPPDILICPFTDRVMVDPVQGPWGLVVERKFFEACMILRFKPERNQAGRSVPNSKVVASFGVPRIDIQDGIAKWCEVMGYELPDPIDDKTAMRIATKLKEEKAKRSRAALEGLLKHYFGLEN